EERHRPRPPAAAGRLSKARRGTGGEGEVGCGRRRPAHSGEGVTDIATLAERTRSSDRIGRSTRPGRPNWLRAIWRQHGRPRPVMLVVAGGGLIDRSNQGDSRNLRRADTPTCLEGCLWLYGG